MKPSSENAAFWDFVLAEHARSGLSISEFCRREGVSQTSFYYWRKKLAGSNSASPGRFATADFADRGTPGEAARSARFASFVPVQVVSSSDSNGRLRAAGSRNVPEHERPVQADHIAPVGLTIRTPGGYAVDVSVSTPADMVERVIRTLGQIQCEGSAIPSGGGFRGGASS